MRALALLAGVAAAIAVVTTDAFPALASDAERTAVSPSASAAYVLRRPPPPPLDGLPPPPDGYFTLQPVGSWSSLPDGTSCAGQVHRSTWEPRPDNTRRNGNTPNAQAVHDSFSSRLRG